jgi:GDP-4-dehydro-6-deoxy-D-mannose reductase
VQRALVTGVHGFVGAHLRARLERDGVEVVALEADVRDADAVRAEIAAARPDAVVHLAALASVAAAWEAGRELWDVNATGTLNVAWAARDARLLVVSSGEVYGDVPAERQPIREDEPLRPRSPYGASKLGAEAAALLAARDAIVARSFNHIGPGQSDRFAVASFAAQVAAIERGEAEPVLRVGNLEAERDLLDVRDVVDAYVRLLATPGTAGVYNVAGGRALRLREVLERLLALAERPIAVEVDPARLRPADIPRLAGDASRLRAATGWQPTRALDDTLSDVLAASRSRGVVR